MIAAIILAAVTATASPSSASTASPQNQPVYKPLREVVYNVVANLQINQTTESFPGYNPQDQELPNSEAGPPASTASTGNYGVDTVDVMAVAPDGTLGIHVTEAWTGMRPVSFDGAVTPDGTVEFPNSTINDVTRELLSYFGTKFAPSDGLDTNTRWQVNQPFANGNVLTDYSIMAVNGAIVTIQKKQTIAKFNVYTEGTIQYEAATLVPISGRIMRRMSSSFEDPGTEFARGDTTSRDRTLTLRFDRVSDTHRDSANH
jgi:hypothetical protein